MLERERGETVDTLERERGETIDASENAATHLVLKYIPFFTYPKSNRGFSSPPQYSTIKH